MTFDTAALSADLEKALGFSAADHGKQLSFHGLSAGGTVTLDKGMLFQVAENLTTNALRFAKENVSVELSIEGENLKLEIADDGDGFPAELLKSGIQPFRKGAFGHGTLYLQSSLPQTRRYVENRKYRYRGCCLRYFENLITLERFLRFAFYTLLIKPIRRVFSWIFK